MPTLNWIGKEKVINHHQDVPYKILEKQYTFADGKETNITESDNKIIHGDNLEALKSLLPAYEGKIKCIYIDPPYNTGEENWVYNDNVNNPKLKKWLGNIVGKESEDLSRHDKWLCMMYPRLKLLYKLLADDGVIFISIDDNEQANLRLICDELFGVNKHIATNVWQKRYSRENRQAIGDVHEYIVVYSKNPREFKNYRKLLPPTKAQEKVYRNPNNDPKGRWRPIPMTAQAGHATASQFYEVKAPKGKIHIPPEGRCWAISQDTYNELLKNGRIYFGKNNNSQPNMIRYLSEVEGVAPWTWWNYEEVGHTDEAKKEIYKILGKKNAFDTPKPLRLIERIIRMATSSNDIILDSFAGTGTTAQAVLNLNKEDGGNRKFILVEMEDYANTITAERVKRVINGYGVDKKAVAGTGGNFSFYNLGKPLFLENELLNEEVGLEKIQEYIWFSETKSTFIAEKENYLLGKANNTAYYFYYIKNELTTLDERFLRTLKTKASQYIVYADNCLLDQKLMEKYHIIFKKIPRDISRF
ncbi:site-specific DNA-methyltransferase [Polaribacter sp. M15]